MESPPPYDGGLSHSPATHQFKQQPGPATSGDFYYQDKQNPSVGFTFCPDPSRSPMRQDWLARLEVKCSDVPRLMREGFYWDQANVVKEDGFFEHDTGLFKRQDCKQWAGVRHYFLKHRAEDQKPRWIAHIQIFAMGLETLFRFDLSRLSLAMIRIATAESQAGRKIYTYVHDSHHWRFNTIYDDMPMKGWWPWPRETRKEDNKPCDAGTLQVNLPS
ncbi:hypothetical protein F4808DRAFT_103801 [Astrocystis sublimbata]|nr:hypothetical protein F4808DRAFT_103801 [Astrocystis sublimbata]